MQLGRYQILKHLARGSVADVLLARATGLEGFARHVVIKRIRPDLAREERFVQSFLEEARIAATLHHQNIVQVYDIGEQDGTYYFAMEYVHGEDVRKLMLRVREREQLVPLQHVVAIIMATAAGLQHAHDQKSPSGEPLGLVHRDVAPSNILIGYDGSVKLVDFELAKAVLRAQQTAAGSLKGKASYMAPEQCMGRDADRRTDVFALGIVLYELCTAQRLFKSNNEFMTMAAIVEGEIPPPSTLRADIPPALDAIILRSLQRSPEARFQTTDDLREALEQFAVEHMLRTSNKALSDYMTSLFGQRPEPWHATADTELAAAMSDDSKAKGLVAVREGDASLIERHAVRRTSPLVMAQGLAEQVEPADAAPTGARDVDSEWDDAGSDDSDEHAPTGAREPSLQMAAQAHADQEPTRDERPPTTQPIRGEDDPGDATLIAAPLFPDLEPTAPPTPAVSPTAPIDDEEPTKARDDDADTLIPGGNEDEPTLTPGLSPRATTATGGDGPAGAELPGVDVPPPRPPGEHIYVGPPAPRPDRIAQLKRLVSTYRRPLAIGGGIGLFGLVLIVLLARSCGDDAAAASVRAEPTDTATSASGDPR